MDLTGINELLGGVVESLCESMVFFASARKTLGRGTSEEKEELRKLDKKLSNLESRVKVWNTSGGLTNLEMDKIRGRRKVSAAKKEMNKCYKRLTGDWSVGSTIQKRKAEIEVYKVYLDEIQVASAHKKKYGYI